MKNSQETPAQNIEAMLQRTAIGMLVLALAYALSAAEFWLGLEAEDLIQKIQTVLSILIVFIIFPAFYKGIKTLRSCGDIQLFEDGYLPDVFKHASAQAFSFTFIFLIACEMFIKNIAIEMPPLFFIHVVQSFTLGVFSMSFFLQLSNDSSS